MRRRRAEKREISPDAKFSSQLIGKFINMLMLDGKKEKAETIVYKALEILTEQTGNKNTAEVFSKAIDNVRPLLEVKSRRIGGATYQVPIEVKPKRGVFLSMMWVRNFARNKKGRPMDQKLGQELIDAYNKVGQAVKKKEDTHKMAEANKAFSHYRW